MHGDSDTRMCLQDKVVREKWKLWLMLHEATEYVSFEKRLRRNKFVRPSFRRALFSRRWEIVRRQISDQYKEILRIVADQLNGKHKEVVSSVSGMASPCYKGIGFQSWSLCCGLNLTVDLKVPFQVCLDITCSDCWFVVRSRAHCEDHQENTELSLAMQWHFFFLWEEHLTSWHHLSGKWLGDRSNIHSPRASCSFLRHPPAFLPALLPLALGILCFPLKDVSFHFLHAILAAVSPLSSCCSLKTFTQVLPTLLAFSGNLSLPSLGRLGL